MNLQIGKASIKGNGNRENQDLYGGLIRPDMSLFFMLDGHGVNGKTIVQIVKQSILEFVKLNIENIKTDPIKYIYEIYINANSKISEIRYGGTTCTIVLIIANKLYTANVGDSEALLCMLKKNKINDKKHIIDTVLFNKKKIEEIEEIEETIMSNDIDETMLNDIEENHLVLTESHSPESIHEFKRLVRDYPNKLDNRKPEALLKYASINQNIFEFDELNQVQKSTCIKSIPPKNIRNELPTIISNGDIILAFTRSIGDIELKKIGVTEEPSISIVELEPLLNDVLCIVIATDGLWDNWEYNKIQEFVMYPNCIEAIEKYSDGSQKVADSLIARTQTYAKTHFGNNTDDTSLILLYFTVNNKFSEFEQFEF